jgi:hypothetical protein
MTAVKAQVCAYADTNGVPVPAPSWAAEVGDWEGSPDRLPWRNVACEWRQGDNSVCLNATQNVDGSVELEAALLDGDMCEPLF